MKIGIHQYMDQLREHVQTTGKNTFMYSELPDSLKLKDYTMTKLKNRGYIRAIGYDPKTENKIWQVQNGYSGGFPSEEKLKQIADMLKAGKKITHIQRDLHTNCDTIKKVESGLI